MVKVTIIDGNDEIELSTAPKENIKAYMVKGEPGSDGVSPTATVSKSGSTTTITVTDKNGTTSEDVEDGYSPTVTTSKTNKITTLTITDIDGTRTTQILDGVDLTGGVPTNAIIGFDGTASEIPNGYEVTTEPFPSNGGGIIALKTITTAPSTFSEGDKYYNSTDDLIYTATSSSSWDNGETPNATSLYLNEADNKLYRYYNNTMNLEGGAGETLPVGSEIDYDGSTVPTGWEEITNPNIYSTDEIKTNKIWIDGKPIYRKVINMGTLNNATGKTVNHGISNLDKTVGIMGIADNGSTYILGAGFNDEIYWSKTALIWNTKTNRTTYTAYVVLEYTKTTD